MKNKSEAQRVNVSEHTPGPWRTHAFDILAGDQMVAVVGTEEQGGVSFSEATCNASLIAAAPELLAFIRMLVAGAESNAVEPMDLLEQAKALIIKAEASPSSQGGK